MKAASAVREKIATLLVAGRSVADIVNDMHLPPSVVFGHCDALVVAGRVRRSDILFAIPSERRKWLVKILREELTPAEAVDAKLLIRTHVAKDIQTFLRYGLNEPLLGDLYEQIRDMEVALHQLVCKTLAHYFGASQWWSKAIPADIRATCERRLSGDRQPSNAPKFYLNCGDLVTVIEANWTLFRSFFPRDRQREILGELRRLTTVRNWVMHPSRRHVPTRDDFEFVRGRPTQCSRRRRPEVSSNRALEQTSGALGRAEGAARCLAPVLSRQVRQFWCAPTFARRMDEVDRGRLKGAATVHLPNRALRRVELHWYEAHGR